MMLLMDNVVTKPWGNETILTSPDLPYTAKILNLKAGQRLSLQYHDQKTETLTLVSGQARIILGNSVDSLTTTDMQVFQGYTISPNTIHRIEAVSDSIIFEASSSEQGTTFRLQDDNSRKDETPDIRDLPNRGWPNE